jgi:hypothetical protein
MKIKSITLIVLFLISAAFTTQAQPNRKKGGKAPLVKLKTKKVIRRTAIVVNYAHKMVKQNKVYTGNLAKSVRHQRYARFLYRNGKYARAIHHSRRARQLAFLAIQANKGTTQKEWELTKDEAPDDGTVSDAELEKELPGEELKEEDLINALDADVDIAENE